jgi:hypothetical protein
LVVAVTGVLMIGPAGALASGNAVYTSTDATQGGCLNASPTNDKNCNIYESKGDVYLSGGPTQGAGLGAGDYFFAILAPGGQADPTDGADGNLSNSDAYADRKFHINADGSLTNLGTHADGTDVDGRDVIQAMPYDDTPNPGGVYILAVCKWLGDEGANDATVPSKCKYDAFKIKASENNGGAADDPVVTKDAKPTFKRTFTWDIDKSVECAGGSPYGTYDQLVQKVSGTVKCDYTIDVTKSDGVDSDWLVKGTISVFNPNDDGSVTLDDVTDDIGDPNATCSVDTATNGLVVPAAATVEYTYECTFDDPPDPTSGTNTASASWSEQTVGGATLAANGGTGTAAFTFDDGTEDNPKKIDDCTDVSDVLDGTSVPLSPDQVCETTQITATAYFDVPKSGCVDHSNTATETPVDEGDAESDSASVRICGPVGGEGTMGFWQNKNGQALIKAGSSTAGVCNSATYLRTYAPFQDLSASATCNQVATYVTNIIKAANASGASMNAMLKAQMLSTALDVSFNKVPGNVLMDLTKVNKPIGSANYENVTAAFGGASSLTVSQMLTYAASKSNVGGSVWYGQVKATQEQAKDAFDAINNGVALSI